MNRIREMATGIFGAALTLAAPIAFAHQNADAPPTSPPPGAEESTPAQPSAEPTPARPIEELDQNIRIALRRLDLAEEREAEAAKAAPKIEIGAKGFILRSGDGAFQLRIRGLLQVDSRSYFQDAPAPDTLELRRARPYVEATFYNLFDLRLMPDFAEGKTVLFDAYIDLHPWNALRLRAGKFKPPVGLERLQSAQNLHFIERGLPTALVPNRDVGVMIHGEVWQGTLLYAIGLFNGVADGGNGDVDVIDGKDVAGRIFIHPLALVSYRFKLGVGVAATFGKQRGLPTAPNLPSFKTVGQQTFFGYLSDGTAAATVVSNGTHYRVTPQAYAYFGRFGLLTEYVQSVQDVKKAAQFATIANAAWQVALSVVLTGEDATYDGVKPLAPLDISKGTWGAFEIGARYNELRVDDAAFPIFADPGKSAKQARSLGGTLNWYPNLNLRFSIDFEWTRFEAGKAQNAAREDEAALFTRLQAAF